MKIYTIIGGANGVGKSSLLGSLAMERSDLGIVIDTDKMNAKLCGERIKGGHDISEADVRRRFTKRLSDLAAVLPYCNEVHFLDN